MSGLFAQGLVASSMANSGWVRHGSSAGYSVSCPTGWTTRQDPESGRVTLHGQGATLAIWPVFLPSHGLTAAEAIAADRSLASKVWAGAKWTRSERVSDEAVRLTGGHRVAALAWTPTASGCAGIWYGADFGPEGAKLGPVFARILASFKVHGKAQEATSRTADRLSFTEYAEQGERAFSFEAPEGWTVKSAVSRSNPYDDRPVVVASAPDESVIVRLNDSRVPGCILPSQMLNMVGGEGHWYDSGGGVRLLILHFMRPEEALRAYLGKILSQNVQDIRVTGYRDRPDLTRQLQSPYYRDVSVGDIKFSCSFKGRDYNGALECCTGGLRGSTIWGVGYLCGYLAIPGKENEGLDAVVELIKTFRDNAAWRERENARVGGLSKTLAAQFDSNRKALMSGWESNERTKGSVSQKWHEANLFQTQLVDPDTGAKVTVGSGHDYYWIGGNGDVLGTDTDAVPKHGDYRRLMAPPF